MVSATRIEGGSQVFSETVQNTIQSIREIVGNHSDTEIYNTLKESNMDPNETTQKLLNQDPFHEVKRKRDKKKESAGNDNSTDQRRHFEVVGQGVRVNTRPDRNARRGGYSRTALPGVSREFRVVRDNRVNHDTTKEAKPTSVLPATSSVENASGKGSVGSSRSEKLSGGRNSPQESKSLTDNHIKTFQEPSSSGFICKEPSVEKHVSAPSSASVGVQAGKGNNAQSQSAAVASSSSAVGVYSSSTDPVHVPSPDSRSSGAIKREVGVVGVRRQSSDNFKSSAPGSSSANSHVRGESSAEMLRSFTNLAKSNEHHQNPESVVPNMSVSRSLLGGGHYNNRQPHQQTVGHQKAPQPNKEWKPKSSQKPRSPGVIGSPTKSASPSANDTKNVESELAKVQDKVTRLGIHENQNVIIAQHIRVPETDRCQLTFGSFGKDFDATSNLADGFQAGLAVGGSNGELTVSLSAPESSVDDVSCSKQVDLIDENLRPSGTDSPPSGAASENQLPEKKESSSPRNLDNYADIGLVQDDTPSNDPSESQQQEPGFSAYDPSSYDIPYFRPTVDESMRGQGLHTHQEAFSHNVNSGTASTIAMVQQQQQQQQQGAPNMQMYPQQVHMPHYANLMPYRQFISPVYVPPMAMPGYSSSTAYPPHPSNANSYVLMPGGAAHLNANSLKYGVQQYKPVPAATTPTAFGNFPNPNGYAMPMTTPVGGATGLEESSRLKYKDGNLYVPNPQAETSELWMANPRDMAGMQSSSYYNMAGQSAYMPPHSAFNVAAAQSSHMQFPGVFHPPPQQSAMATHHLGPANSAPGTQVGAYQQPQLGHRNWTTNF